ncbi:MAG TPA: cytochrome d ubiquinol oxidase subunit II [Ktedonobacteraceae bacterium]|nr:cytochrome d ubiquinol oxidase subunit II [Ktedonobacteraceae bacterium]
MATPPTPFPIGAFIWLLVAVMSLTMYMALDGYDLGVGILMLTESDTNRHKEMMEIIATAWDGNESWFVLLGISLFAGFPLAYSIILPAFYLPFILMLLSLVFRGMSLEFQSHSPNYERKYSLAFSLGSLVATFCQGVMVGAFVTGIPVQHGHFVGTPFAFLNGYSLLAGLFFVCSFCLTGASWLNDKMEGEPAANAIRKGRILTPVVGVLLVALAILAPFVSPVVGNALSTIQLLTTIGTTLLALIFLVLTWYTLKHLGNVLPFLFAVFALALPLLNLLILSYPYVVPASVTFWQAAAPQSSVNFLLVGVGSCIPIVLAYNTYAYYVFRGKFTPYFIHRQSAGIAASALAAVSHADRNDVTNVEPERSEGI